MQFNDIVIFCGEKSFKKGQECSIDDFIHLFVQDDVIFGLYCGTVGVYKINVIFKKDMISYAWCTCPAMDQWDGFCKHIAGLLIHWFNTRKKFKRLYSWQEALENKTKEELINLIKNFTAKSIEATSDLYEELFDEVIVDKEDLCYKEW